MDPLHPRLQATAIRLIGRYGKPAQIIQHGTPTGPAWDPQLGADVLTACVWIEAENRIQKRTGTVIQTGDRFGYVSVAAAVAPAVAMDFEADGQRYSFVAIEPLNPGGLTMYYEIHLRQ